MRPTIPSILAALALTATVAACGSGNSLSTGSLIGGSSASPTASEPKPISPSERALHVGATAARAQRCGFVFDPEQLKASFLAAEQQAGTPPDQLQKVTKEYDFTRQTVLSAAAKDDTYCTEGRNREVKAALTRQLAGDFNPPRQRQDINVGLFDHQKRDAPLDGQKVFDASAKRNNPRDQ